MDTVSKYPLSFLSDMNLLVRPTSLASLEARTAPDEVKNWHLVPSKTELPSISPSSPERTMSTPATPERCPSELRIGEKTFAVRTFSPSRVVTTGSLINVAGAFALSSICSTVNSETMSFLILPFLSRM